MFHAAPLFPSAVNPRFHSLFHELFTVCIYALDRVRQQQVPRIRSGKETTFEMVTTELEQIPDVLLEPLQQTDGDCGTECQQSAGLLSLFLFDCGPE